MLSSHNRTRFNRSWDILSQAVAGASCSCKSFIGPALTLFLLTYTPLTADSPPLEPFTPPAPHHTPEGITANRQSSAVSTGSTISLVIASSPSAAQLTQFRGFPEPLLPVSKDCTEASRATLANAINTWMERTTHDDFSDLESYVQSHPECPWVPAILLNLGKLQYHTGYFSKALTSWQTAWQTTQNLESPAAIAIANASVSEYAVMLARIGRKTELDAILEATASRTFQGSDLVMIDRAREGQWAMEHRPEISFKCGPYALEALHVLAHGEPQQGFFDSIDSPPIGFSLIELKAFAQAGLDTEYQVAKRNPGAPLILPSVVHWNLDHYGALIREQDGAVLLQDPTFGNDTWMTHAAINSESSGYFLVPAGPLPHGWQAVDDVAAATIFGKGYSSSTDNDETSDCSDKSGGDCGGGRGMAGYAFHTMLASLHIHDIPIEYPVARGPSVEFKVAYNMRENGQPATMQFTNFSPRWVSQWVSYLTDNPAKPAADIKIFLPGGGAETHTGFNSTTQSFTKNRRWGSVLVRTSPNTYERRHPDGSKHIYAQAIGTSGPARRVFLTQVVDAQGNSATLNYDTTSGLETRLASVTDAAGLTSTFSYNQSGEPYLVTSISDPFSRIATFDYQSVAGATRLVKITDTIGLESTFEYNSAGLIVAMETPYGRTTFSFGTTGNNSGFVRWIQANDPQGSIERIEYHNRGFLSGLSNAVPAGQVPSIAGVDFGNHHMDDANTFFWDKKAWAMGPGDYSKAHITNWGYTSSFTTASGLPHSIKPAFENRIWFRYPGQTGTTKNQGTSHRPSIIARRIEDGEGGFTTAAIRHTYNDLGNPTQILDPAGRETVIEYAANGIDPTTIKHRIGGTLQTLQSFIYNPAFPPHRPASVTDAAGETTTFTYTTHGQIETVTNPLNETTTFTYDSTHGRLIGITGPLIDSTVTLTYDGFERIRTVTDSAGHTTTYDYDAFDRVTLITYPDTTTEQFSYEKLDLHAHKDRQGRWTRTWHNALRQPVLTADALGRMLQFQWCKCGDLKKLIDAKGQITFWKHDAQGRIHEKQYPDGRTEKLTYEPLSGRLSTITDAMDQVKTLQYFTDGNLRSQTYSNLAPGTAPTANVSFTYDPDLGMLQSMTDGIGTTDITYHPVGTLGALQVSTIDGPLPGTSDLIAHTYDELGRLKTRNIGPTGTENLTTWNFDPLGRINSLIHNLGTFGYDYVSTTDRLAEIQTSNGQRTEFDYYTATDDHRLKTIHHQTASNATLSRFDYGYSTDGTITNWDRQFGSAPATRYALGYDRANQLTTATLGTPSPSSASGLTDVLSRHSYQYDKAGNRTSTQLDGIVTSASHNIANQITEMEGGGKLLVAGHTDKPAKITVNGIPAETDADNNYQAWIDVETGVNTITVEAEDWPPNANTATQSWTVDVAGTPNRAFTYDNNGNTLTDGLRAYQWDAENRLVKITYADGSTTEFTYNSLSQRTRIIEKDAASTITSDKRYLWADNFQPVEQRATDGATVLKRYYLQGEQRLSGSDAGFYYYTRDHLGSIRELIDSSGTIRALYDYDPYGQREKLTGDLDTEISFTGHPFHAASGLHLTLFRAYDSEIGRWLTTDPIGENGGINVYVYASNNPINHLDELGLCDINFFNKNDRIGGAFGTNFRDAANRNIPKNHPYYFTVGGHGNALYMWDQRLGMDPSVRMNYYARELSVIIKSNPNWNSSKKVVIASCNTGKGPTPLAQRLADELSAGVIAPNDYSWYGKNIGGEVRSPGRWILFRPSKPPLTLPEGFTPW